MGTPFGVLQGSIYVCGESGVRESSGKGRGLGGLGGFEGVSAGFDWSSGLGAEGFSSSKISCPHPNRV